MNIRQLRFAGLFCIGVTLAAYAGAARAADFLDTCQAQLAADIVTIKVVPAEVSSTIRRVSAQVLSKAEGAAHRSDGVVLGHTGTQWAIDHQTRVMGLQNDSEAVYCYKPEVHLTLALSPIQVSVASEVKDGCAMDYVLEHEQEHVRLFIAGLPAAAAAIRAELNEKLGELRIGSSVQEVVQDVLPGLTAQVVDIIVRQVKAQEDVHLSFDQDDAHHMEQHGCYQALRNTAQKVSMR